MSDALIGVIIGGSFGFLGAITGIIANTYLDHKRARRERLREVHLRLVGDQIQTSEVLDYLRTSRRRMWPRFWLVEHPDLSRANLRDVDLRGVNMAYVKLFRANLAGSDLDYTNLSYTDLSKAELIRADLSHANLTGAKLIGAKITDEQLARARSLAGAI